MRGLLIFLTILLMLAVIATYGYVVYRDREQVKDFSGNLGSSIRTCGRVYDNSTAEFIAVQSWLKEHQEGWSEYFITVPTGQFIIGENLNLIVADRLVVAQSSWGSYSRSSSTTSIEIKCE